MAYYLDVNEHMKSMFENKEKVVELRSLPRENERKQLRENVLYKVPFIVMTMEINNYHELLKTTNNAVMAMIMAEFVSGATKIIKHYGGYEVEVTHGGLFATFVGSTKNDVDSAFICACSLNAFKKHINRMVDNYFLNEIAPRNGKSHNLATRASLEIGVGVWLSFDNYIAKALPSEGRGFIYLGQSIAKSKYLASIAGKNGKATILMNDLFDKNFTAEKKELLQTKGGYSQLSDETLRQKIYQCDWTIRNYDQFVDHELN